MHNIIVDHCFHIAYLSFVLGIQYSVVTTFLNQFKHNYSSKIKIAYYYYKSGLFEKTPIAIQGDFFKLHGFWWQLTMAKHCLLFSLPDFKCWLVVGRVEFFVCSLPDLPVYLYSIVCLKDKLEQLGGWSDQTDRKCVLGRAAQCALHTNHLLCTLRKEKKRKKCLTSKIYWGVISVLQNIVRGLKHRKNCKCYPVSLFIVMLWGSQLSEMSAISQLLLYCHLKVFSLCHCHCLCVS